MSGRTDLLRVMCGEAASRVPVVPLLGAFSARLVGYPVGRCLADPGLQAEAQLAAVEALAPDAVFPFMDLSAEAEALGAQVRWPGEGAPEIAKTVEPDALLGALRQKDTSAGRLPVFTETVRLLAGRAEGRYAVGAYVSGPWTLVATALGLAQAARLLRRDRETAAPLIEAAVRFGAALAADFSSAGADLVMVLEPCVAGGIMSPADFTALVRPALDGMLSQCRGCGPLPVLHVCGDARGVLPLLGPPAEYGLSVDAPVDLQYAAQHLHEGAALWGNVDPVDVLMRGTPEGVTAHCRRCMGAMAKRGGFVLASGCEVPPDAPLDNLRAMVGSAR